MKDASAGRHAPWRAWASGVVLLAVVVIVVRNLPEEERAAELARAAEPAWLLFAAGLQLATYACGAAVWRSALPSRPPRPPLRRLLPLSLAKLFTDQVVPSAGLAGTLLVVQGLMRRGVQREDAVVAMVVGLASYYVAYAIAVGVALVALFAAGEANPFFMTLAVVLAVIAAAVPAAVIGMGPRLAGRMPAALARLPAIREAVGELAAMPREAVFVDHRVLTGTGLQLAVFALDAATLAAMLLAVGIAAPAGAVFASFMFASVVATVSLVPGGLGTFEGACVALLAAHGVGADAALAATLLLRAFTFWLPMVPGLLLARRELAEPTIPS